MYKRQSIGSGAVESAYIRSNGFAKFIGLEVGSRTVRPYRETLGLSFTSATPTSAPGVVNSWKYTYTQLGSMLKISVNITAYSAVAATLCEWYLKKSNITVATGKFVFNQSGVHINLPILFYIDIQAISDPVEWSIHLGNN